MLLSASRSHLIVVDLQERLLPAIHEHEQNDDKTLRNSLTTALVDAAEGQYSIDRHTIQSRVAIHDGETLILGGLIKETKSTVEAGVPYLRRLPLLGHLFQDQDTADRYTETVIYVTPRLNDGRSFDETTEETAIDEKLKDLEERQRKRSRRW